MTEVNSKKIVSLSSATGWYAVYQHRSDKSVFKVPLVSWALVHGWDACDWTEDAESSAVIGLVMSANNYIPVPAPEAELADEGHTDENPAYFCGYIESSYELNKEDWQPVWGAELDLPEVDV